jgi:glycosyltransferase involved in cell wall biosynthesis
MATGLVPVVSDLKCFRDFIDEGQTGYYFDHRGTDAAHKLSKVVRAAILNQEQTSQMSIEAVRKASNFSYDRIGSLYLEDFAELLSTATRESHRATEIGYNKPKLSEISTKSNLPS